MPGNSHAMSRKTGLSGERLYLRELRLDDVGEMYLRWMNDPHVTDQLESRFEAHSLESLRQYVAAMQADPDSTLFAMVVSKGERHIGNIKLGPVVRSHATADIGLLIGEKDCWGLGYATDAISLVCRYAFDVLGLHKVTASCYSSNEASARAFEKAGFVREGLRVEQFAAKGGRVHQVMLGKLRSDA